MREWTNRVRDLCSDVWETWRFCAGQLVELEGSAKERQTRSSYQLEPFMGERGGPRKASSNALTQ